MNTKNFLDKLQQINRGLPVTLVPEISGYLQVKPTSNLWLLQVNFVVNFLQSYLILRVYFFLCVYKSNYHEKRDLNTQGHG